MRTNKGFTLFIGVVLTLIFATITLGQTQKFIPPEGNPYSPMNIFLIDASVNGHNMSEGDEIGVFDDNLCVGASVFPDVEVSFSAPLEVIATKDDGSGNGFTEGDTIIFKLWDASEDTIYIFKPDSNYNNEVQFYDTGTQDSIALVPFYSFATAAVGLTGGTMSHTLTMAASPEEGGTTTPGVGAHEYTADTTITVTAEPATGYRFVYWSGDVADPNSVTTTVTIDSNKTVTAHFQLKTYSLTVNVDPSVGGSATKAPDKTEYNHGESVTLTATSNEGYEFDHWSGSASGSDPTVTFTMDSDKTVTANFRIRTYPLTVNVEPSGGGSVTKAPDKTEYDHGESVTLTATPNGGYVFNHWSGDASGSDPTVILTMNSAKTVTANFTQLSYTLTVTVNPSAGGSVAKSPDKATYTYGEQVTLTATSATGYNFIRWEGDASSTDLSTTVTIDGNKNITAVFEQISGLILIVSSNPSAGGSVSKNPEKSGYTYGENVTLTANSGAEYRFVNWTGDASGSDLTVTLTMDSDKTVTANYIRRYTLTVSVNTPDWGTTNPTVGDHVYDSGGVVTITATPASSRYQFVNWTGGTVGDPNSATTTVKIDGDKSVTANFEDTVPVELVSFTAELRSGNGFRQEAVLSWQTASETNNLGFDIERAFEMQPKTWETLGFVDGYGTSNSPHQYSFVDNTVSSVGTFFYRLKQIDTDGAFEYSDEIDIQIHRPLNFSLSQNYPNPFNPATVIAFDLPQKSEVKLELIDVLGNVVKVIAKGGYEAGHYEVELKVQDLSTGVYFYKIEAGGFIDVKKLTVVK